MRLIDADELKKRTMKVGFPDAPECGEFDAVAVYEIDIMPTIDQESLRTTARWKHGGIDGNSYTVNWICRIVDWYWNSQMSYPEDLTHVTH